jgi:nucleoside-diphosphate-sugar epimerase
MKKIIVTDYHRPGDILYAKGNIYKIKTELNWVPKYDLEYGLSKFIKWVISEN